MVNVENVKKVSDRVTKRDYGIDFLRMIAMAMVVTLHVLSKSKLLSDADPESLKYYVVWFIEIACYCAVDCFVIISGYVGLRSRFRLSRILLLWLQVAFYSVVFELSFQIIDGEINAKALVQSFMPIMMKKYWFFTQYFVLSLIIPFLNKLMKGLNIRQSVFLNSVLFIFLSVVTLLRASPIPVIGAGKNVDPYVVSRGYSFIWLIYMYLVGAMIKMLAEKGYLDKIKKFWLIPCFIVSCCVTLVIVYICNHLENTVDFYFAISYTAPLILFNAVLLFLLFETFTLVNGYSA